MDPAASLAAQLVEHGLLIRTGVDGLYGRSGVFENIVDGINSLVTRWGGDDGAEVMRFPPGITRQHFEESDYIKSFPQLAGAVHSFMGDEREYLALLDAVDRKEDWTSSLKPTEVVMTPAACYPVYPTLAARGPLPENGALVDVYSYCFRHEPSTDPTRMLLFRMREYIRIGTQEQVVDFRKLWLERGQQLMASLLMPMSIDVANDPFFGRTGRMLMANQRDQRLKFELLIPVVSEEKHTACMSFNYHQDHFGQLWNLRTANGDVAQTACVGWGMERITIALLKHHGFDVAHWPAAVRDVLWG